MTEPCGDGRGRVRFQIGIGEALLEVIAPAFGESMSAGEAFDGLAVKGIALRP